MDYLKRKEIWYQFVATGWLVCTVCCICYAVFAAPHMAWNNQLTLSVVGTVSGLFGLWTAVEMIGIHREGMFLVMFAQAYVNQKKANDLLNIFADELLQAYRTQSDFLESAKIQRKKGRRRKGMSAEDRASAAADAFADLKRDEERQERKVRWHSEQFWLRYNLLQKMTQRGYLDLALGDSFKDYVSGTMPPGEPGEREPEAA